eukprot:506636_1
MQLDGFMDRHIGPSDKDVSEMLSVVGAQSLEDLMTKTVPENIRSGRALGLKPPVSEAGALSELSSMMGRNQRFRSHLGAGYYDCLTPAVILRNMIENPSWYTPYTPYQAEIAQGRLEMLINFQTMICDLTGLPVANCSLLDEATAAGEAMSMSWRLTKEKKNVFLISENVHLQTIEVVRTRAEALGVEVRLVSQDQWDFSKGDVCGMLLQYPGTNGEVKDYAELAGKAKESGVTVVAASDLLALTMLKPPGEWGADIVVGSAQRFGVPLGWGGPHAGFMSARAGLERRLPGRVIGVSTDKEGNRAYRMALQTREQHIKRERATSNICTAQALLANVSAAYAIYHGPNGLKEIAERT